MRRDIEQAVRIRVSPSLDLVLSRRGALLVRGDRVFRLDDREIRRIATEIGVDRSPGEAVSSILRALDEPDGDPAVQAAPRA